MLPNYCQPIDIENRLVKLIYLCDSRIPVGFARTVDDGWCAIVQLYQYGDIIAMEALSEVKLPAEHYEEFNEIAHEICEKYNVCFVNLSKSDKRCSRRNKTQKEDLLVVDTAEKEVNDESGK